MSDVPMTLTASGNTLSWTITNQSGQSLFHGNGGFAGLQVLLNGVWYDVPKLDGPHWAVTLEGYSLSPSEEFSSTFSWAPYAGLPDGTYRLTFPLNVLTHAEVEPFHGCAAASFQLKNGVPVIL